MSTFVIVHGAWGGGWEWTPVARLLRQRGHDVYTPTLTGVGERAYLLADQPIGLSTHVRDIVSLVEFEGLGDVVLCAGSSGGMAVTGAADRLADRVRLVIYVDALVPRDGQSALDLLPEEFALWVREGLEEHGPSWRVPLPPGLRNTLLPPGSLPEDDRRRYLERVRDHPAASFSEPVSLSGAIDGIPRAFIRCTGSDFTGQLGSDPIEAGAARARDEGWPYRELAVPHDPQVYDPVGTAELLDELARST